VQDTGKATPQSKNTSLQGQALEATAPPSIKPAAPVGGAGRLGAGAGASLYSSDSGKGKGSRQASLNPSFTSRLPYVLTVRLFDCGWALCAFRAVVALRKCVRHLASVVFS